MNRIGRKRARGVSIAEAAASLTLLLPLMMTILFVVLEASYAYLIKTSLNEAAREAGRDLSVAYGQDASIAGNRTLEDAQVFDTIRITNMVNNSAQFSEPVWNTSSSPPTVTVGVTYTSGQYGLPTFPNPDPLGLSGQLTISASSTYRLE